MITDTGTGMHSRPVFFSGKTSESLSGNFFGNMLGQHVSQLYTVYRNTVQRVRVMRSTGIEIIGFLCSKKDKKLCINPLQYPGIYYILKKLV